MGAVLPMRIYRVAALIGALALAGGTLVSAPAVRADTPQYVLEAVDPPLTPWIGQTVPVQVRVTPIPVDDFVIVVGGSSLDIDPQKGIAGGDWTIPDVPTLDVTFALARGTADPLTITITPRRFVTTMTLSGPVDPVGRGDPVLLDLDIHPMDGYPLTSGQVGLWAPNGAYWAFDIVSGSVVDGHVRLKFWYTPEPGTGYGVHAVLRGDSVVGTVTSNEVTFDVFDRTTTITLTPPTSPLAMWEPAIWNVKLDPIPDDGGHVQLYYKDDIGFMRPLDWVPMDWSTGTGSVDHPPDVGTTTLYARFEGSGGQPRWAEAWSDPATVTVVDCSIADPEAAPGGPSPFGPPWLVVNGWNGPAQTNPTSSPDVELSLSSTTGIEHFSAVRLSNMNQTCGGALRSGRTMALPGPFSWSLIDPTMGGTDTDGLKNIFVQFRDVDGRWTQPFPDEVVLDRTAPQVGTVAASLRVGDGVASTSAPIRLGWSASDAGGGLRYDVQRLAADGSWDTVVGGVPVTAVTIRAAPGVADRYAVLAVDGAGNADLKPADRSVTPVLVSDAATGTHISGRWTRTTTSTALGHLMRTSRTAGATLSYTFTGRSVGWIAPAGGTRGKARVFVDGVAVATVDLGRLAAGSRQIVWARTWASSGRHVVRIQVLGTPGRPRVDVDGFIVLR